MIKEKKIWLVGVVSVVALTVITGLAWVARNVWLSYQEAQINDQLAHAQNFFDQGQYQEALGLYQTLGVKNSDVRLNLTEIYLRLGRFKEGQAEWAQLNNPRSKRTDDLEKIIQLYQRADNPQVQLYERAQAARDLLGADYTLLAITLFNQLIQDQPGYRDLHLLLGTAYFKNREPEAALKSLERAREIDPVYPTTFRLMSQIYLSLGEQRKADELEKKAELLENP